MSTTCAPRTRFGRRLNSFVQKRVDRFLRPVLERLEERTLLSGDLQPPIVQMEKPVSHDPDHPDVVPSPAIEVRANATDQFTGDSGISANGFRFEFRDKAGGSPFGPWTSFGGFNTQVSTTSTVTIVTTLFHGVPNHIYGFRVLATDGANNRGISDETYASPAINDINPDVVIVVDNLGCP